MRKVKINEEIHRWNLKPFDVIVARSRGINLVDHFIVYIGYNQFFGHLFAGNLKNGARYLSQSEVEDLLEEYVPTSIRRFSGDTRLAQNRLDHVISKPYNLATDNCEHFANYVQTGNYRSEQSGKIAFGVVGVLAIAAIIGLSNSR